MRHLVDEHGRRRDPPLLADVARRAEAAADARPRCQPYLDPEVSCAIGDVARAASTAPKCPREEGGAGAQGRQVGLNSWALAVASARCSAVRTSRARGQSVVPTCGCRADPGIDGGTDPGAIASRPADPQATRAHQSRRSDAAPGLGVARAISVYRGGRQVENSADVQAISAASIAAAVGSQTATCPRANGRFVTAYNTGRSAAACAAAIPLAVFQFGRRRTQVHIGAIVGAVRDQPCRLAASRRHGAVHGTRADRPTGLIVTVAGAHSRRRTVPVTIANQSATKRSAKRLRRTRGRAVLGSRLGASPPMRTIHQSFRSAHSGFRFRLGATFGRAKIAGQPRYRALTE